MSVHASGLDRCELLLGLAVQCVIICLVLRHIKSIQTGTNVLNLEQEAKKMCC